MCVGAPGVATPTDKAYVWDLPTRLFHWLLVTLVAGAFVTESIGGNAMIWHGRCGLAIVGLLTFRIVWGFAGSTYARFTQFVRGPAALRDYLQGKWLGQGHNPVGAISVLALLGLLAAMAATGLFANDDIAFRGYLAAMVSEELSAGITGLHKLLSDALVVLLILHVGAIAFYARVKKHNLVIPMLTGWAAGKPCESAKGGGAIAFVIAVVVAVVAVYAASGALLPPPETIAAPAAAPAF